jgi:L-serine dehydratase
MGLFGGLLGWEADDERLPNSPQALAEAGVTIRIETVDVGDPHPNTYRLTLRNAREQHALIAISTGGGMMEVIGIDGVPMNMDGGYHETLIWQPTGPAPSFDADEVIVHDGGAFQIIQVKAAAFVSTAGLPRATAVKRLAPVLPVPSRKGLRVPFTSCAEMLASDGERNTPLWKLAAEYEMARGQFTEREVIDRMIGIVRILRRSIASGLAGTTYADRVLGHQSGRFKALLDAGRLLDSGALNRIVLYLSLIHI